MHPGHLTTHAATCARAVAVVAIVIATLLLGTGGARADSQGCSPGSDVGCISGTIRTADGDPAEGVALTVEGPTGVLEAETGADGRWSVEITESGEYTVTLDESTLPDGETLRDPDANPRTLEAEVGRNSAALFPLGAQTTGGGQTPTETSTGGEASTDGEEAATDDGEADAAAESETQRGNNRVVQLFVSGLIFGLLLALASVGANLIYGTTGVSNFAHGDLVTLGGLFGYMSVQWWGLPLWLATIVATAAGAVAGWALDAGVFARLRRRGVGVTQQLIVTIGIALAMLNLYLALFRAAPLPIVSTIPERINFGLFSFSLRTLILALVAALVLAAVVVVLQRTRLGRATRAVADNPALAAATGINVNQIVRVVWVSSASLAALGGVLMGVYLGATRFNFGSVLLLLMFAAITLGGLGSPLGGLIGALVIGVVVEMSTLFLANDLRYATALVILVLVLLFRPQGILGRPQRIG